MRFDAEQRRYVPAQCVLELARQEDPSFRVGNTLPEPLLRRLFRGIVEGMEYMHTHFLVHRDLKPENVLVTKTGTCKLADFGCAHSFSEEDEAHEALRVTRTEGTPHFFAPECVTGDSFDPFAVDAWALGVNLYALTFGELPVDGRDAAAMFEALQRFRYGLAPPPSPALARTRVVVVGSLTRPPIGACAALCDLRTALPPSVTSSLNCSTRTPPAASPCPT